MKRAGLLSAVLLIASPVLASECDAFQQLGALYEIRSLMLRGSISSSDVHTVVDRRIEQLREPLPDGGYRWVRWVRPSGSGPADKHVHTVSASHDSGDADSFEATGQHAYAVRVVVPAKRSLFKGNNRVFVGDLALTDDDGSDTKPINHWMNPDTAETFDLRGIQDHVRARTDVSVEQRDVREAVAEIHFLQAVPQDDPDNPAYPTIQALNRIRDTTDPNTIDYEIAQLENSLFASSSSIPLLAIVRDLRRADELMRSERPADQEKGNKLLKETLRRLR